MIVRTFLCISAFAYGGVSAFAEPRLIDLEADYAVAQTVLHQFDPLTHPDMDGDGQSDLEGQSNIASLLDILADDSHPNHLSVLAAFEFNETIATTALHSRYLNDPFVPYMAEVWAVFMTIQGSGTFVGPSTTGMVGLVEHTWNLLEFDLTLGALDTQDWYQSEVFGGSGATANIVATGGGLVYRGDRVVLAVVPANALTYTWYKNNGPLIGHGASTMVFDPVALDDAGTYYCEVTTADKALLQTPAITLTVTDPPVLPAIGSATSWALGILVAMAATRYARRVTSMRA